MRIAIIIEHVHTRGGQERVIAELVRRLCDRHELHLYCFSAEDLPSENVHLHILWCPWSSAILQSLWIVLLTWLMVRPGRFDVVLSQGGNAINQNWVLVHTCHDLRAKVLRKVQWVHKSLRGRRRAAMGLRAWLASWFEGRAMRHCRGRVIAVSRMLRDCLVSHHCLGRSDVHVANNGVDHEIFNESVRARYREQWRAELGLPDDDFVILFVGGRWFEKGLPHLIEALGQMASAHARLVVVGEGDVEGLSRLAAQNNVAERVMFCPPTQHLERYYGAADCLALLSETEGFGLVAAEAAACGLPVLMSRSGVAVDLIEDGVSGFIVGASPLVVADRLDRLATNPQLCLRMGQAAHQRSLALTWEAQAGTIERLFQAWHDGQQAGSLPYGTGKAASGGREAVLETATVAKRPDRVRVAVVSHSCVVPINQGLYAELAKYDDIEPLLITPLYWRSVLSGPMIFSPLPGVSEFARPLPVHLPGQIHLHWYNQHIRAVLNEFGPELLFVDEEPYSLTAWQSLRLARQLGCHLMISTKENLLRRYPLPLAWTQRQVLREAAHAIVVCSECESVLQRKGYQGPATELPHGIDPKIFCPAPHPHLRSRLGLVGPVVGYVGRLTPEKGVLDLLEAAILTRELECPRFQLLLVGEGPLYSQIKALAPSKLGPNGIVLVNRIPHEEIADYLNCLDVLVLPSRTTSQWKEQFGRVLVEALACQVPVIGSSSGHIPHLIADTQGGLVFEEGNASDLAGKITALLSDSQLVAAYAQRGRQRVLESYTWQAIAEKLRHVIMEVAHS